MIAIIGKLNDGGPFFTYPILLMLLIILGLFVSALLRKIGEKKVIDLMGSIGWFAVAWGFLGRTMGLIMAFDMVAASGEVTPRLLSEGFKMALVDPLMGISVFLVARLGIIILIAMRKEK